MNPRDRLIAGALLAGIVLAAGTFLFYELYLQPLSQSQAALDETQKAVDTLNDRFQKVKHQKEELKPWRELSLPGDKDFSKIRYYEFLTQIMKKCGFAAAEVKEAADTSNVYSGGLLPSAVKAPPYQALDFRVAGRGDLGKVVRLLEEFYRAPLLHKIKQLKIDRKAAHAPPASYGPHPKVGAALAHKEELDIELVVEAIIVQGAEPREELMPKGQQAHSLAPSHRDYLAITGKNPFYPPPSQLPKLEGPDPAQSIKLTMISSDSEGPKAVLYDDAAKSVCYLCPKTGHVLFEIKGKPGEPPLKAELVQIDEAGHKIIFTADDKLYALVFDQSLAEALRRPLTMAQMRALELTRAPGSNGAQ